jgi:hypothetical protein
MKPAAATDLQLVDTLNEQIRAVLAGHPPHVQGAVLAHCLALWLAGHWVPGDRAATDALRCEMRALHLEAVEDLLPVLAQDLGTDW